MPKNAKRAAPGSARALAVKTPKDNWAEIERKAEKKAAEQERAKSEGEIPYWERDRVRVFVATLPEAEREPFKALVDDYKACAVFVHGSAFVSMKVLAEMVKLGWRKTKT